MKTKRIILSILIVMLMISTVANASSNRYIDIKLNGKGMKVLQVPVTLNNKVIDGDAPAILYVDRTLVPARFISENYGAKVEWIHKTRTVIITHGKDRVEFTIDSPVIKFNGETRKLDANSVAKLVQFKGPDAVTMVPLNFLGELLNYETEWDAVNRIAHIIEKPAEIEFDNEEEKDKEEVKPEPKPDPKPEEIKKYNVVSGVEMSSVNGEKKIVVKGTNKVKRNVINLKNPDRMVIDLLDSELVDKTKVLTYDYDLGVVDRVRVSQWTPDENYSPDDRIVRVVLDLKAGESNPNVHIAESGNNLILTPEKSFWDKIKYSNGVLTIKKERPGQERVNYNRAKKALEITIPSNSVNLKAGSKRIKDDLVGEIKIEESGGMTKIIVRSRPVILFNDISQNKNDEIKLSFRKDPNITNADRTIVIDPGHGGRQPGTTSITGAKEKDMALQIGRKLEDRLRAKGYKVIMTRTGDTTLGLEERAVIANDNFADIFISIHGNAFANNASVKGIETYHYSKETDPMKGDQQRDLAKMIQEELIRSTGASSRGVKTANFAVLRHSEMPGVLVEVGFLSNPEEERLLLSPAYQDKVVSGMVQGIDIYFNKY